MGILYHATNNISDFMAVVTYHDGEHSIVSQTGSDRIWLHVLGQDVLSGEVSGDVAMLVRSLFVYPLHK